MSSIDDLLKQELGTSILRRTGKTAMGCISEGIAFEIDSGTVFVKVNKKPGAMQMFEGEFESLTTIGATETVRVPKPIEIIKNPKGGGMLVMEYLDFVKLSSQAATLGENMARLHLHNSQQKANLAKAEQSIHHKSNNYISKFGFPVTTCCGFLPQDNTWMDSWVDFYARRIDLNIKCLEKEFGERDARTAWSTLCPSLPKLFTGLNIEPALIHGDLWIGNSGQTASGPVIYDPASFYGHDEFDLSISTMFGGFGKAYYSAYHKLIPKQAGFEERQDLYCLFHYLNHWTHFGEGYKGSTMNILQSLIKKFVN